MRFPNLERVGTYVTPRSALIKSLDELRELRRLGLKITYMGVETGDEELLLKINKGATYDQIVEAGRKLKHAGITSSVTVILGLGGVEGSEKHASRTARILTDIDPDFVGALTIMLVPGTPLYRYHQDKKFNLISSLQSLNELKIIIQESNYTSCFFTANHASNYLPIKVRLPERKEGILKLIDDILVNKETSQLRSESMRVL
jgi:radical SAM superfamily enzyme YgiQ (UPF0313 family)